MFTFVHGKKDVRRIYICTRQEGLMKGFKYVLGKNDGRKGIHIYAASRTEERIYICTRQEGRNKGFTYVRGKKDGRKDLHMYVAIRTEEWI